MEQYIKINTPKTDESAERHSFYGELAVAISSVSEKIELLRTNIIDNVHTDRTHFDELRLSLEKVHSRVNKRTYKDDSKELDKRVDLVESNQVKFDTGFTTAKTMILGAWLIFSILFGGAFTLLLNNFRSYVDIIETSEVAISEHQYKLNTINNALLVRQSEYAIQQSAIDTSMDSLKELQHAITAIQSIHTSNVARHQAQDVFIDNFETKLNTLESQIKQQYDKLNRLKGEVNRIHETN